MSSLPLPSLRRSAFVCGADFRGARFLHNSRIATASSSVNASPLARPSRGCSAVADPRYCKSIRASATARYSSSVSHLQCQSSASGSVFLSHRRLVSLSGPDAAKFLQGLVTNNVDASRHAPFYAAFLNARGRVLWDVFIWVWPELVAANSGHWACYIEIDQSEVVPLMQYLKRHRLRSKVVIEQIDQAGVWAAWGDTAGLVRKEQVTSLLQDPRAPGLHRYLLLQHRNSLVEGINAVDPSEYHFQRYLHGIAEGPIEITRESALPMECNLDLSSGIDFKKGCYVGQELTIRTKHTGVVRKRILPVRLQSLSASHIQTPGAVITQLDEAGKPKKGRPCGKIIAGVGDVGLALCRLEMMTSMEIKGEEGRRDLDTQFGVDTVDGVVKVKAVVHDWFFLRERNIWHNHKTHSDDMNQ